MNQLINSTPPLWYWISAGGALLWYLLAGGLYIVELVVSDTTLVKLFGSDNANYLRARPLCIIICYGIFGFSGLAGSIALLLQPDYAFGLLCLSVIALLVLHHYWWIVYDIRQMMKGTADYIFPILISLLAVYLVWLSYVST